MVTLADTPGSSRLEAVAVTLMAAVTGAGAVYEIVVVPLALGPTGVPTMAPATVGLKVHVTAAVVIVPVTSAFRFDVCPSVRALELALKVTLTAP
jgi:hypothetical protein